MEDCVVILSDSNPASSPLAGLVADLDDDIEFPTSRLSEICGSSDFSKPAKDFSNKNPKGDVCVSVGGSKVDGQFLSCEAVQKEENRSDISLSDDLSGPSNSIFQPHANRNFPKTNSFHDLSDSVSSDDTIEPVSPKSTFEGLSGGGNAPWDSPIWDQVDDEIISKRAPVHELSDSDSDKTIPAVGSPESVDVVMYKNSEPLYPKHDFATNSDDGTSTIRLSNSNFKLGIPLSENSIGSCDTLPPSRGSCDTLPPSGGSCDTLHPSRGSRGTLHPMRGSRDTLPPSRGSCDTLPPSRGSFDTLPPSRGSCDTLPPSRSPDPFVILSDKSTHSYPSIFNPAADNDAALFQSNSEPLFPTSCSISEFVTQLGSNSQPLDLNNGSKPPRKRTKYSTEDILERKRLKELKEKEKAEKAAAAESLRRLRPGECLKYVTAVLDERIVTEYPWGPGVVRILELSNVKHQVKVAPDPCTVQWTRDQVGSLSPADESQIIFLWSIDKLLTSVQYGTFIDTFAEYKKKYSTHKLLLAVYGLHEYYKKHHQAEKRRKRTDASQNPNGPPARKRKSAYEVTETQIEMELIALQVRLGISHKALNSPQDAALFLQVITKSVAELPFKLEREKIDEERNWYAKGDSRNCVRIDKDFNGMGQLWLQQLAQFNNSSLDTAKAIAQIYPSPLSLYNAYKEKSTSKEKEQMLQEIVVKRGSGGGGRRLGPELSKKISLMFCQDEDVPLS